MLSGELSEREEVSHRSIEYFSILGEEITDRLIESRIVKKYAKGDIISQSIDYQNRILLIYDGFVKILVFLVDGREFVIDTPSRGTVFGEIDVIAPIKTSFEAQALTACEIWALDAKIVRDAISADHQVAIGMLHYAIRRVKQLEDRLVCLTSGVSSRLASTLLRLSASQGRCGRHDNIINISQHELASMLPASREKVNRCLRQWERSRIVNLAPGTITITNQRALHEYVTC